MKTTPCAFRHREEDGDLFPAMTQVEKLENTTVRLFYMLFEHCGLKEREQLVAVLHGNSTPFVDKRDGQFSLTCAHDMQDGTQLVPVSYFANMRLDVNYTIRVMFETIYKMV
jgi:hypothetical protein